MAKLKNAWEHIFEKYGRNFDDEADEIDLNTGEIVVDRGHLRGMKGRPLGSGMEGYEDGDDEGEGKEEDDEDEEDEEDEEEVSEDEEEEDEESDGESDVKNNVRTENDDKVTDEICYKKVDQKDRKNTSKKKKPTTTPSLPSMHFLATEFAKKKALWQHRIRKERDNGEFGFL